MMHGEKQTMKMQINARAWLGEVVPGMAFSWTSFFRGCDEVKVEVHGF
jgi:hypothetical protein